MSSGRYAWEAVREMVEWDRQARTDPRAAVWAEPEEWWQWGVDLSLKRILSDVNAPKITGRVLDLGCGIGRVAIPYAQAVPDDLVIGVDVSAEMLRVADETAREQGVDNVMWLHGDGRNLPDDVGPLDGAWSMLMFQHIPKRAVAFYIRQVARRLVTGGVFRFQFVEGSGSEFLAHDLTIYFVEGVCHGAGLDATFDVDLCYPTWRWCTAIRR